MTEVETKAGIYVVQASWPGSDLRRLRVGFSTNLSSLLEQEKRWGDDPAVDLELLYACPGNVAAAKALHDALAEPPEVSNGHGDWLGLRYGEERREAAVEWIRKHAEAITRSRAAERRRNAASASKRLREARELVNDLYLRNRLEEEIALEEWERADAELAELLDGVEGERLGPRAKALRAKFDAEFGAWRRERA